MHIGSEIVPTPYDDDEDPGVTFEPEWRMRVAIHWKDGRGSIPKSERVSTDRYVIEQRSFLNNMEKNHNRCTLGPSYRSYRFAFARYNETNIESMRFKLESLLLTNASYNVIARDLGGDRVSEEDIRTYERVYFNIRDDQGNLTDSCYLKHRFALPQGIVVSRATPTPTLWKFIASQIGYGGLVRFWGWTGCHGGVISDLDFNREVYRVALNTIYHRLLSGETNNLDITTFMSHTTDYERFNSELTTGAAASQKTKSERFVIDFLKNKAPRMAEMAETADEHKEKIKVWQAKVKAQENIAGVKVDDVGKLVGQRAMSEIFSERFKSPTEG